MCRKHMIASSVRRSPARPARVVSPPAVLQAALPLLLLSACTPARSLAGTGRALRRHRACARWSCTRASRLSPGASRGTSTSAAAHPRLLRTEQLERLIGAMQRFLPWDAVEEVTFECEPGTLHERKLQVLRDLGITRISLGVESFSDDVLKSNNRGHTSKHIYRAYDFVRKLGFPQVNIDLIAGMLNEREEEWREGVRKAVDMAADCVDHLPDGDYLQLAKSTRP